MGTNFGALTDHFSLASADMIVVGPCPKTPVALSKADAIDDNGDPAAATWYGATDIYDVSVTYALISNTLNLNTLDIGELTVGTVASSIAANTANGAWPQITVTGRTGLDTITAPTGFLNTWSLPEITLTGIKAAQLLGFTVEAGKLSGSTATFSCDIAEQTNGLGMPVAHGVSGATGEVTAEFTNTADAQPAWTVSLAGLTETQAPSTDEPQAAYHTSSAAAEMIISRDASA